MLVLALQFSKGNGRGRRFKEIEPGTPWAAGAELHAVRRGSATQMGRLPQNGREDKARRAGLSRGTNPTIDLPFRLTHQCTNWEWFEPGRTNAYQRLNCSP
jgi:hypothetical protein